MDEPGTAPPERPAPAMAGWARCDSDNVMRGWVTDRSDPATRFEVDVTIDDELVASVVADRLDAKLVELKEGDGRYAFAVAVPARFYDRQPHGFRVTTRSGFMLKCKSDEFAVADSATPPAATFARMEGAVITGTLDGGQIAKSSPLEFWSGDRRLEPSVTPRWTGKPGALQFSVDVPSDLMLSRLTDRLRLAAPGMVEAGLAVAEIPALSLGFSASQNDQGRIRLIANEALVGPDGGWGVRIVAEADGAVLIERAVRFEAGQAWVTAGALPEGRLIASLTLRGVEATSSATPVRRRPGGLVDNPAFQNWEAQGPVGWSAPPEVEASRGFFAFPPKILRTAGLSGDCLHLQLATAPVEETVLLSQTLDEAPPPGAPIPAKAVIRASAPARLRLRLSAPDGELLGEAMLDIDRAWTWSQINRIIPALDQEQAGARLDLVVLAGEAVDFDIAGLTLGDGPFVTPERPVESLPAENLVVNADLTQWPRGLAVDDLALRGEIAEGWTASKRRSDKPIRARAILADVESDAIAIALASPDPALCRFEVRLRPESLTMGRGVLSFEVGMPPAARRLLAGTLAPAPEQAFIERVMILKRTTGPKGAGFEMRDEKAAIPARRLLVTRDYHRFSLPFSLPRKDGEFDWDEDEGGAVEHYVTFEFAQPFAVAFRNVAVVAGAELQHAGAEGQLRLEDRNIESQAASVVGLAPWIAPLAVGPRATSGAGDAGLTWRWSGPRETVEIVVCVHDAIDDVLACLQSTIGSTSLPHTVRIIDDGSSPGAAARLVEFVRDKPWMHIVRSDENRGYTWSADLGVRGSSADWVVLLNSDTLVTRGWLEGLLDCARSDPAIAFVGPLSNAASFQSAPELYDDKNKWKTNPLPAGWSPQDVADVVAAASRRDYPDVPLLNGFCTLMKRSVFLEVGGFDAEAFPAGYGEENDLCLRVSKAGYRLVVADDVYVYHVKSASFGTSRRDELSKKGGSALRTLHPDVDLARLTAGFRDTPALVAMRAAVRAAYDNAL